MKGMKRMEKRERKQKGWIISLDERKKKYEIKLEIEKKLKRQRTKAH